MTHICVGKLTNIGSDNGLSPGRRRANIWTNAGILLIGPWGTNFSEIVIGIQTFSFKKIHLQMPSANWRPFCPDLNVLKSKLWINNIYLLYHGWGTTQQCEWILDELRNRFCTIFATDSWQRTRGRDECVYKMTNTIHNHRFVKTCIIHNIA